jgi:hypothetical protein
MRPSSRPPGSASDLLRAFAVTRESAQHRHVRQRRRATCSHPRRPGSRPIGLVRELDAARVKAFAENGSTCGNDSVPTLRELRARGSGPRW